MEQTTKDQSVVKRTEVHDTQHVEETMAKPTFLGRLTGSRNDKTADIFSVAFVDAVAKDAPNYLAASQLKLYALVLFATLCCIQNGYDGSVMGSINAMDQWHDYFDVPKDGGPRLGAIYNAGNIVGSFVAGLIADKFGRRPGMMTGAIFILVGSIVQATSQTRAAFIGGRFLTGLGVPISVTAAPTYLVEIAYPTWRGIAGGLYNVLGWYVGSLTASWTCYGTGTIPNNWSWRIPYIIQAFPAVVVLSLVYFVPESPRWLLDRGREEEAKKFLVAYHGNGNPESAVVKLQLDEIRQSLGMEAELKRGAWWDYRPLFSSRPALHRLYLVLLISVFAQFTGGAVIAYFMPTILENAGITSSQQQLLMNGLNNVFSFCSGLAGSFFVEKIGRRPMLLWGVFLTGLVYVPINVLAGLANGNIDKASSYAFIAMLFLYGVFSSFTWSPLQALYPAEVFNNDIRAKGMAAQSFIAGAAGFINMYATPIALRNIGWKAYTIFLSLHVLHWFLMYFVTVETKGKTLEEIEEIFEDPHPVKRSKQKTRMIVATGVGVLADPKSV